MQPLMEAGLDSLGAVELRNALGHRFGIPTPATLAFDHPSINALAAFIASTLPTAQPAPAAMPAPPEGTAGRAGTTCVLATACQLPGAAQQDISSPGRFLAAMAAGTDIQRLTPPSRWDTDALYSPAPAPGAIYTRFGAYLAAPEAFDGALFGLSGAECLGLDPQSRLLLELVQAAVQQLPEGAMGRQPGAFVGCMNQEYFDVLGMGGGAITSAAATGNSLSFMAGRCSPQHLASQPW